MIFFLRHECVIVSFDNFPNYTMLQAGSSVTDVVSTLITTVFSEPTAAAIDARLIALNVNKV